MIVGNGLIANAFKKVDVDDVIFFASGVSNSLETDKEQFQREENLIRKTIAGNSEKLFVYFSTCSIYDSSKSDSDYVNHKLNMEHIVSTECSKYLIARVSNAVGKGGNPNLLMNYLYNAVKTNSKIIIHQNAKRNLIDVEDVRSIVTSLIEDKIHNKIINVAFKENFSIIDIVEAFEKKLGMIALKEVQNKGASYTIDISEIHSSFIDESTQAYLNQLIAKYYGSNG